MGKSDEKINLRIERRVHQAVNEYTLNRDGITYQMQGIQLHGGEVPYMKLLEHIVIADALSTAQREKVNKKWLSLRTSTD